MTQLTVAVVIVEVVGEVDAIRNGVAACHECLPVIVKACDGATPLTFRLWETNGRASHGNTGSDGNATLLVVVDSTVEMIDNAIVLDHIRFMGKHLVVGLRGDDEVVALPTLPVNEVATDSKGVEGIVLA